MQVFLETSALDPLKLELQTLRAARCGCWKLNQHLLQDQQELLTGSHLSSPHLHLFSWLYHSHRLCHKLHYKVFILNIIEENFFSAKMQILLPLQSIKTCSKERGVFLAAAPSEGAETKLWHPDTLKVLGSLGSYEPLLDLEVFIEYPVI